MLREASMIFSDSQSDNPGSLFCINPLAAGKAVLSDTQLIRTILNASSDTIYFKDSESRFIMNSKAHAVQFGFTDSSELTGKSDADFYPEAFVRKAIQDEQEIMRTGRPIIGIVEKWDRPDGNSIWFSASKYPLFNDLGQIVGTWGTSRDITDLKTAEQELERVNARLEQANAKLLELAVIDELSGLFNRRNFDDILRKTFNNYLRMRERIMPANFCLMILDIDDFKQINDTYGHLSGDTAIKYIANLLTAHARSSDFSFRYGGDEYAVILPDTNYQGGLELAERLRIIVENNPLLIRNESVNMTVSIGISNFENHTGPEQMILEADMNLYHCKHEGKNRCK